jgi:hypothetical protein
MSTICTIATTVAALIAFPAAALAQDVPAAAPTPLPASPLAEPAPAPAAAAPPAAAPPVAAPPVADDEDPTLARQLALAETKAAAGTEPPPPPLERDGLTVEVSLGVAAVDVTIDGENGEDDTGTVVGGRTFAVSAGGYVAPRFVLGGRVVVASAAAYDSFLESESTLTTVLIGPSLQLWAHDRLFLAGTAGVATVFDNLPATAADQGPGVEARVGVVAPLTRGHGLVVAASVNSTLLDEWSITSYGVQVGWQGF